VHRFTGNKQQMATGRGVTEFEISFSGLQESESQPCEIYMQDIQVYETTSNMGSQRGVINGQMPKMRRSNDSSSTDHEVTFMVKCPKINKKY